jgi:hypothetical protein
MTLHNPLELEDVELLSSVYFYRVFLYTYFKFFFTFDEEEVRKVRRSKRFITLLPYFLFYLSLI